MSIAPPAGKHPVAAALEAMTAALDAAADASMWAVDSAELVTLLEARERLSARLDELGLRLVREADRRDLAGREGASSTAVLLRHRLRLVPGEAKARVELARAVDGELARTGAALAAGDVSYEQAQAVRRDDAARGVWPKVYRHAGPGYGRVPSRLCPRHRRAMPFPQVSDGLVRVCDRFVGSEINFCG